MEYCKNGCGNIGIKQLKDGSWICNNSHQKCPVNRKKYSQVGNNNPMFGKQCSFKGMSKDTYEPLKKLSEKIKDNHKNGKCAPPKSFINYWKGKTHSASTKLKIAKSMKGNTFGKGLGNITEYNGIKMRSSWEAKVAKFLDDNKIIWKYEEKTFTLNSRSSYRPDFFIYDESGKFIKLIEVKGYFREANKIKFNLFNELYPDILVELWDESVLKKKGIL